MNDEVVSANFTAVYSEGRKAQITCDKCGWRSDPQQDADPYDMVRRHVLAGKCRPSVAFLVRRFLAYPVPMWLMLVSAMLVGYVVGLVR